MNKEEFKLQFINQFNTTNHPIYHLVGIPATYGEIRSHMALSCSEFKLKIDLKMDKHSKKYDFVFQEEQAPSDFDNDISDNRARFFNRTYLNESLVIDGSEITFGYLGIQLKHIDHEFVSYVAKDYEAATVTIDVRSRTIRYEGCVNLKGFIESVDAVLLLKHIPIKEHIITDVEIMDLLALVKDKRNDKDMLQFISTILYDAMTNRGDRTLAEIVIPMVKQLETSII